MKCSIDNKEYRHMLYPQSPSERVLSGGYREASGGKCPEGPAAAVVRTVGAAAATVSVCVGYGLQVGQAVGCGGHPCYGAEGEGHLAVL